MRLQDVQTPPPMAGKSTPHCWQVNATTWVIEDCAGGQRNRPRCIRGHCNDAMAALPSPEPV
jgi:hypothetical protein